MKKLISATILFTSLISFAKQGEDFRFSKIAKPMPQAGDLIILFPLSGKGKVVTDRGNNLEVQDFDDRDRTFTTFKVVQGFVGGKTVSLQSMEKSDEYMVHKTGALYFVQKNDSEEFKQGASFRLSQSIGDDDALSIELGNHPGYYVHVGEKLIDVVLQTKDVEADDVSFYYEALKPADMKVKQAQANLKAANPSETEITIEVTGKGRVEMAGQSCSTGTCTFKTPQGTGSSVYFTAVPDNLYELQKWGDACKGENPVCLVQLKAGMKISATFFRPRSMILEATRPEGGIIQIEREQCRPDVPSSSCTFEITTNQVVDIYGSTIGDKFSLAGWTGICAGTPVGPTFSRCRVQIVKSKGKIGLDTKKNEAPQKKLTIKADPSRPYDVDGGTTRGNTELMFSQGYRVNFHARADRGWVIDFTGCTPFAENGWCYVDMTGDRTVEIKWRDTFED